MLQRHVRPQSVVSATDVRRNFGAVVKRLRATNEHTIIQRSGAPVAVMLSVEEYERLLSQKQLAAFHAFARELGREIETRGLSEEELLSDLEETKQGVFAERYGRPN